MKILRIFLNKDPLISRLRRQLPHRGEALWLTSLTLFSLPLGEGGPLLNERWMRDDSDYLELPDSVTLSLQRSIKLGNVSREVRRRSRSDPDHPVNGREGEERAAYVRPVSSSELSYRGSPLAGRRRSRRGAR